MHVTLRLLSSTTRLTLFTRANCGLCDVAKTRIQEYLQAQKTQLGSQSNSVPDYREIDIMATGQQKWRDVYDFDVPVLHIDKGLQADEVTTVYAAKKLMHRFTVDEVSGAVDDVEQAKTDS